MNWSTQQKDIFDWFRNGSGNLVVRARAGAGKTTTIVEAINYAPESKILLKAFNKSIAVELQERLCNPRAEAKTSHSLGFGFVRKQLGSVTLDTKVPWDKKRARTLAMAALEKVDKSVPPKTIITNVARLITNAREIEPFLASKHHEDAIERVIDLAYQFDQVPDAASEILGWSVGRIAESVVEGVKLAAQPTQIIDFTDMIFLPVVNNWVTPRYDLVCVDEAQDMNACQLHLALKVCKEGGRIAVIGDDKQAIYGFRGADSGSLDRLKDELEAEELGLPITYRCPTSVVYEANRLVEDFYAADGAKEGTVDKIYSSKLSQHAQPGDFVVSRTNAPLMRVCLDLIKNNIRAKIQGREIGKALSAIVNKLSKNQNYMGVDEFLPLLDEWATVEYSRAMTAERNKFAALILDRAETIRIVAEGRKTVKDILFKIDDLFGEPATEFGTVVCSTVHKVKGLEAPRVFLLKDTFRRSNHPKALSSATEEMNIEYVAITRAKNHLTWVLGDVNPEDPYGE